MKRMGTRLLPVLLCALLTLTACGGGSNSAASRPADNNMVSTDSAPQAPAEGEYGWALDGADTAARGGEDHLHRRRGSGDQGI